jgi:hypothetical protein
MEWRSEGLLVVLMAVRKVGLMEDRLEWCSEDLMVGLMADRLEWCSEGPMVDPLAALKVVPMEVRRVVQALENELRPVSMGLLVALLEQMIRG